MMEPEQPEANASSLSSDSLQASVGEEQSPLGFDSRHLGGEGDDVLSQVPPQMNQKLLINFDMDKEDTVGIVQPQRTSSGTDDLLQSILQPQRTSTRTEEFTEDEYQGIPQPQRTSTGTEEVTEDEYPGIPQPRRTSTGTEAFKEDDYPGIPQPQRTSTGTEEFTEDEYQGIPQPQRTSTGTEEFTEDDYPGIPQPQRTSTGTEKFAEDEYPGIPQPQMTSTGTEKFTEDEYLGILQPQRTSTGTEEFTADERRKHSDAVVDSDEENPNASIGDEKGSPQERHGYESAVTGFGTFPSAVADDDNDDDEHNNRYVLETQDFRIHAGAEAEAGFDLLGNENHYFPHTQPEEDKQEEPPELLFQPDESTDYIADNENSYIRQVQPSPPEADLDIAEGAPEIEFEPDISAGHNSDGDENRFIRQSQSLVPEDDLETAQESPELQFEPDVAGDHGSDAEENYLYIPHSQPFAPEDDLETAQESPELQFEPDVAGVHGSDGEENHPYIPHSQPFAPEDDLKGAQESPELPFEPDVAGVHGSDGEENHPYIPHSQPFAPEDDLQTAQESPELQFEPDVAGVHGSDGEENDRYIPHSQPFAPEVDLETAQDSPEFHFESDDEESQFTGHLQPSVPEADLDATFPARHLDEYDNDKGSGGGEGEGEGDGDEDDEDEQYIPESQRAAYHAEAEPPELQFQAEDAEKIDDRYFTQSQSSAQEVDRDTFAMHFEHEEAAADEGEYDNDDDGDDVDDENRFTSHRHNVGVAAFEEELPELQSQPGNNLYTASQYDDSGDGEDDGNRHNPRLQNAAQAAVEEEIPEFQSQRDHTLYADNVHDDGEDDDDDDQNHYVIDRNDDQGLGPAHDQHLYDTAEAPSAIHADDDSDAYNEQSRQNVPEYSTGHDHGVPELQYGVNDAAIGADEDEYPGPSLIGSLRSVEPERVLDDEHRHEEDLYQQGSDEYGADDGRHGNDRYIEASEVAREPDDYKEEPDEQEQSPSYEASAAVKDDDNIRYAPRSDETEPTAGYDQTPYESQQQQNSYYDDDNDNDRGIIGSSVVEAAGIQDDEDNPRVLIKGILAEDDVDEQYTEDAYEEENGEEEEGDPDDVIDIRDNANVEDQFIEFEDSSFVEAAVGGILDDAGLNGEGKESHEEIAGDELGATGGTAVGADDGGDHDGLEGAVGASASRVRFADKEDHYNDDYHIIPGASNQSSYDSLDHNHAESDEKSLDVLLLEEICEEAASMTIKEALIHSLKPNVRAGLTTAHLKLSESEVLALEEYCEDFVGGLIKDLLKRSSLMELSSETKKAVVKASVIKTTAKHLSAMEVQQLKVYCDHFVHNVIAESIIDSSMIVARQQHQAEEVKELLRMFQNSEELQEYFTNLTTDIVRTALLNVTAKDDMEDVQDSEQPIESSEYEQTESVDQRSYPGEGFEFENQEDSFDFDGSHSFGITVPHNGSAEYRRSRSQESWTSEDEDEMGTNVAGRSERITSSYYNERSTPGHTSLEFDEEWAEDVIGNIEPTTDGEKRQKIFMRELDFDDRAYVGGTDLLAPVFLAVAEENEDDTEFEGLRRKTQSIEDLCDLIEEEKEPPRKRASSLTRPKKKPRKKPRPNSFHDQIEELKKEAIKEDIAVEEPEEQQPPISPDPPSSPKTSSEKSLFAYDDERYRWHTIRVNNREKVLDLKLIEPYMKVITHGGVHMPTRAVIVVIAACYLPDKTKKNYEFLMEQLFFYLISTLELLATTDEYFLVYFNGGTTQSNQPGLPWMKRFYQHVEGGLKKNMINMFIVHPNFWLKTVVRFAKAFVGTNFWSKLQFIKSLEELSTKIPVEFIYVPDEVVRCDPKYKRVHNL